jgi:hypothetical protein
MTATRTGPTPFAVLRHVLAAAAILAAQAAPAAAQRFRDPEDGRFDVSRHLATATGFLPVPMLITEPAVGYGAALFGAYFHGSIEEWSRRNDGRFRPPSISVAGGFLTENGSWGVAAGHFGVWFQDRVRYLGGIGYVSPNLAVYPAVLGDQRVDFNLEGLILIQGAKARLWRDLFAGLRYIYADTEVRFERDSAVPGIAPRVLDIATGGLQASLELDARDNALSPTRGTRAQATASFYGPGLGGDSTYRQLNALVHQYVNVSRRVALAFRLDGTVSTEGAPFFAMPFLRLRGLPVLEYQGRGVALGETEVRYALDPRWSLIGFMGVGYTDNGRDDRLHSTETVVAGGGGFRYLVARQMGLLAGADIGVGPDQVALYLQVGSAWF